MKKINLSGRVEFKNTIHTRKFKRSIHNSIRDWIHNAVSGNGQGPFNYVVSMEREGKNNFVKCKLILFTDNGETWDGFGEGKNEKRAFHNCLDSIDHYCYQSDLEIWNSYYQSNVY